jgi:hypothetical protein
MRRTLMLCLALLLLVFAVPLLAGRAHFVGSPQIASTDEDLLVSGKVAGLGNVQQIHVELSADAACINPGGHHPNADNKESFSAGGDFPVQNGKALFSLTLTATFQPDCTPPMDVEWTNVRLTVTADDGTLLTFP